MMRVKYLPVFLIAVLFGSCSQPLPKSSVQIVLSDYRQLLNELSAQTEQLTKLAGTPVDRSVMRHQFLKARTAYKKIEWFAEYYYPLTAKKINGPAIPEVEPDEKLIVIQPEGFQVVEAILFSENTGDDSTLLQHTLVLQSNVRRLQSVFAVQETTDGHIFDALRLEIFRIISLGISGFDSPVANNSLPEASAALETVQHFLSIYDEQSFGKQADSVFKKAIQEIPGSQSFLLFDRMKFIRSRLNPLSESITALQFKLKIPFFSEPRLLRSNAENLFTEDIFNPDVYSPGTSFYSTPEKVQLGEKLFYDNLLSGNGKRSCATCHQPAKAFTDGLITSSDIDGKSNIRRNTPTLINAALQPALFYDMRVAYLEDQAKDVITNVDEMHGSFDKALKKINVDKNYTSSFRKIYKEQNISEQHIMNAIASYIRSLVRLNSRFDLYMRGDSKSMTPIEIDGFNTFTGKGKCATCHFVPLFNGSNPPGFEKIDAEIIGVPATADSLHPAADKDEGRYEVYKIGLHKNAFKTPTLRNVELTAPYMHNGVFKTLEEVIEFYNRGGGTGLGLNIPNQTLQGDKLHLSAYEKKALVAFMKSLTN